MQIERTYFLIVLFTLFMLSLPSANALSAVIGGEVYNDGTITVQEIVLKEIPQTSTSISNDEPFVFEIMDENRATRSRLEYYESFTIHIDNDESGDEFIQDVSPLQVSVSLPKNAEYFSVSYDDNLIYYLNFEEDYCYGNRICINCYLYMDFDCENKAISNNNDKNDSLIIVLILLILIVIIIIVMKTIKSRNNHVG